MKHLFRFFLVCLVFSVASIATAQSVSVGTLNQWQGGHIVLLTPPWMLVDHSSAALKAGSVNTGTVYWSTSAPCTAAFKLKFFRRNFTTGFGDFEAFATRGPFDVVNGLNQVTLSPAVALQPDDVIGIVTLKPDSQCGGVRMTYGNGHTTSMEMEDANKLTLRRLNFGSAVNVRASMNGQVLEGTLPVVGSVPGQLGSSFKTSLQLSNAGISTLRGTLLFHPAGRVGTSTDPKLAFSIPPGGALNYADVVAAMGQTGLGSLDVISEGSYAPSVYARIFDDKGAAGTSGFTEDFFRGRDALESSEESALAIVGGNFRTNIGVRSQSGGASIMFLLHAPDGQMLFNPVRTYAADYFEQVSLTQLFSGITIPPGSMLRVKVTAGSAFVYASTTDNRTNDSSMQFARRPRP